MKKKLLVLLALVGSAVGLAGCKGTNTYDSEDDYLSATSFKKVCSHYSAGYTIAFIEDTDTNIMYIEYNSGYQGSLSVYYNKDGEPMTRTEFNKVHKHTEN